VIPELVRTGRPVDKDLLRDEEMPLEQLAGR
jgi:hypothetical protein